MKKAFITFVLLSFCVYGFSQIPEKMSYQCVVRNSNGDLVTNQSIGMRITILQGSASGTVIYQESFNPNPQTNANGLVTLEVGGGVPIIGTFSSINWASGLYFLRTETDPTGGTNYTISGTNQLLSVPYAMHAKTADNGFSGNYYDLSNKPILFSGNYNDLSDRPVLFNGSWDSVTEKPSTLSGYGISDAVTITSNQTISGVKTFTNDLLINGLTIGRGHGAVSSNSALGYQALLSNTTGNYNTANGYQALSSNTIGYCNTAFGYQALYSNVSDLSSAGFPTGSDNTAIGFQALYSNTLAFDNTAVGCQALYSNVWGTENTAIGNEALYRNQDAHGNTAVGFASLAYNETGGYNTAIGASALNNNEDGYANVATGSGALNSNSNGYNNTANGRQALMANRTGNNNVAVGESSGKTNLTGSYNILIGSEADVTAGSLTNAIALGYNTKVNADNKVRIGNSNVTVIEGQVNWSVGSDLRLKEEIVYVNKLGLEFINALKTTTFTYKNDSMKKHHDGLIAQDVKQVLDQLGLEFSGLVESENEEKIMNLSYAEFVVPLINSVQELSKINQEQQNQIDELNILIKTLMANQNGSQDK